MEEKQEPQENEDDINLERRLRYTTRWGMYCLGAATLIFGITLAYVLYSSANIGYGLYKHANAVKESIRDLPIDRAKQFTSHNRKFSDVYDLLKDVPIQDTRVYDTKMLAAQEVLESLDGMERLNKAVQSFKPFFLFKGMFPDSTKRRIIGMLEERINIASRYKGGFYHSFGD